MKFYDYNAAPSPRRARILMAEKGVAVETEQVDLGTRAQFEEPYRTINPRCTVPALALDDGTVLCDNASIARYFEEIYPDPPTLGRTPVEKALVAEWTARVEGEGLMGVAEALRNRSEFFKDSSVTGPNRYAQVPELVERGRARASACLQDLDARLGEAAYLAGDAFSAADIAAYVFVDFTAWIKLPMPEGLENLARWREAVGARPSIQA
ncbi:glutathione S-transferase family protein [Maricaulis sp.]|jgi:glutathione S-transferase|uniref:glutathione S-transferase family protein n=1 Tax=Maricaulis sp. TaxID=1486257 RepID=UPI002625B1D2|nr:glutathione S-transferase family protein [Maricaulis sp.]MDF1767531.1 glutathione S-transferase family protein [Maricaulis sp.]